MPGQGVLVGLAKSLEKLSSGFRINRAADDAAGLAISEGLRSQVGGNRQAVRNAQDGISLVQTAEGALNEVHSILQRMRVLAVQGATDSNSADARQNINTELNQLREELDRIGKVTNFNGTQLLDGSASGQKALKFQVGANGDINNRITVDLKDADVTTVAKFGGKANVSKVEYGQTAALAAANPKATYVFDIGGNTFSVELLKDKDSKADIEAAIRAGMKAAGFEGYVAGGADDATSPDLSKKIVARGAGVDGKYTLNIDGLDAIDVVVGPDAVHGNVGGTMEAIKEAFNDKLKDKGYSMTLSADGKSFVLTATSDETKNKQVSFSMTTDAVGVKDTLKWEGLIGKASGKGYEFTVNKDKTVNFKRADGQNIDIDLAHSVTLLDATAGAGGTKVDLKAKVVGQKALTATRADFSELKDSQFLDVTTHDKAQKLINILDQKIRSVSTARSNLGAVQNRFEHTITNLNVAVENLAASESRVRDTDMAQEMMQFTRNQILSQAGTSMLAQANQVPQGVLSLLR